MRFVTYFVALVFLTLLALNQAPVPWLWILALWSVASFRAYRRGRGEWRRAVWLSTGVICTTLFLIESYAAYRYVLNPATILDYSAKYHRHDDLLGYSVFPGQTATSSRELRGEILFDVDYTIDNNGRRLAPPLNSRNCILFFGGSYTFGEGVEDDETFPWNTGLLLAMPTVNFGFHGYGPHQMLALIESGRVEETIDCEPVYAVYLALNGHAWRSAGKAFWDRTGPRYIVDSSGHAALSGHFDDAATLFGRAGNKVAQKLGQSIAWKQWIVDRRPPLKPEDIKLMGTIIASTQAELLLRWPQSNFLVLHWDPDTDPLSTEIAADLAARGIPVQSLRSWLPGIGNNDADYLIHPPEELHPTRETHLTIAQNLAERLREKMSHMPE